jgi:hypothetical protein
MSKVDWSLAPEATHYLDAGDLNTRFRDLTGDTWKYFNAITGKWVQHYFSSEDLLARHDLIARPKPKQWSGPQDGLPPVGIKCEYGSDESGWKKINVLAHTMVGGTSAVGQTGDNGQICIGAAQYWRPSRTAEQLAADLRETAIREIMDIADVDCRVTAARLVDAGFKREVV